MDIKILAPSFDQIFLWSCYFIKSISQQISILIFEKNSLHLFGRSEYIIPSINLRMQPHLMQKWFLVKAPQQSPPSKSHNSWLFISSQNSSPIHSFFPPSVIFKKKLQMPSAWPIFFANRISFDVKKCFYEVKIDFSATNLYFSSVFLFQI